MTLDSGVAANSVVVDASVAVKWFTTEEGSQSARRVLVGDATLLAPELILAEVSNALWVKFRRAELTRLQLSQAPGALERAFPTLAPLAELAAGALDMAAELDHPVYDCFYLALAQAESSELVTADNRLLASVAATKWAGTVRPLSSYQT